jgi:hypothetical protein
MSYSSVRQDLHASVPADIRPQTLPHTKQAAYGYSFAVRRAVPNQLIGEAGKTKG